MFENLIKKYDPKYIFYTILIVIIEIYKIISACALAVFVPQKCYGLERCQNSGQKHLCTIATNINIFCLKPFNLYVIILNLLTALSFGIVYFVEIKRERFILKHFRKDDSVLENNLIQFATQYETLFIKLTHYNKIYYTCYKIMIVIYVFNSISSLVLFSLSYYDFTTITVFLSSILLCSNKIYNGYTVAEKSLNQIIPISYFNREYILFNSIENKVNDEYDGNITPPKNSIDIGPFISVKKAIRKSLCNKILQETIIEIPTTNV